MTKTLAITALSLSLIACAGRPSPARFAGIAAGTQVTVVNTIQKAAPQQQMGTDGKEVPIEALMGQPAGSLVVQAPMHPDQVEFKGFLRLWNVDATPRSITLTNIVTPEKQPFPGFLRVIEAGTYDRYYITMDTPFCFEPSVDKAHVKVECLSEKQLKLTIGEGYDNRQTGLRVSLN